VEAKRPIVDLIFSGGNWFYENFALCIHDDEEEHNGLVKLIERSGTHDRKRMGVALCVRFRLTPARSLHKIFLRPPSVDVVEHRQLVSKLLHEDRLSSWLARFVPLVANSVCTTNENLE